MAEDEYDVSSIKVLEGLLPPTKRPDGFIAREPEDTDMLSIDDAAAFLDSHPVIVERALEHGALKSLQLGDLKVFKIERERADAIIGDINDTLKD